MAEREKTAESDDLPLRDEIEIEADEGDLAASESNPKAGPESGTTMAVPRFKADLEALLLLTESTTPRIRVVRNTRICTALYGFGDASSDGFGATIERKSGSADQRSKCRLYAPTLQAPEERLLAAITAEHNCPLL